MPQLQSGLFVINSDKSVYHIPMKLPLFSFVTRIKRFFCDIMDHVMNTFVDGSSSIKSKDFQNLKETYKNLTTNFC